MSLSWIRKKENRYESVERQCFWFVCLSTGEKEGVWSQPGEKRTGTGDRRQIGKKFNCVVQAPPSGQCAKAHLSPDIIVLKGWLSVWQCHDYCLKNPNKDASFKCSLFFHQDSKDQKTYFLKIHAPRDVLATYADVLKIKVPFKKSDIPQSQDVALEWLTQPFRLPGNIMHPEPDYFTYHFDKTKTDFFLIGDKDTFFPPSTRNRIVSISKIYFKSLNDFVFY